MGERRNIFWSYSDLGDILRVVLPRTRFFGVRVCCLLFINICCANQSIVISLRGPGRIGDSILSLAKSRYIAWTKKLPFFYTAFTGSDNFMFSRLCKSTSAINFSAWNHRIKVRLYRQLKMLESELV